jgi:spore maturation protein CgeB
MPRENVARLLRTLVEFKPDFLLTINLGGMDVDGMFAGLFEDLEIPFVTWFVDDPRTILEGRGAFATPWSVALSWEERYCGYLRDVGYPVVHPLPLAVDDVVFNGEPTDTWRYPPSFVGNSNVASTEYEWGYFADKPELLNALREAIAAGKANRENFAGGLDCVLEPATVAAMTQDEKRHAELLLFVDGTRRLRLELAHALVPEGMILRGDDDWQATFPGSGGGINYLHDLPTYYRYCELNLNITSLQMATAVNQRVFDCPAAGGFLLTDAQSSLHALFDVETEVAAYSSMDECKELFRFYRANPNARRQIVERARKRILGEHTYTHRLHTIVALLKERFSDGE